MSIENKKTIEVYDKTAKTYIANSIEHDRLDPKRALEKKQELEELIKTSFADVPKGSKVLEIGSGEGLNAKYLKELGYDVTGSDTVDDFVESTKEQGVKAIKLDALNDEILEKYLAVFCWRVFVHFTDEDALKILRKVYDALEDKGVFLFNAINRATRKVDSEWVDFEGEYHMGVERFYHYFTKEELDSLISRTDFEVQDFHTEGGKNNNKWLVYTLKK